MNKIVWIVVLVFVTSCAFAVLDGNGAGKPATGLKAGETTSDGRKVGTPEGELPVTRAEMEAFWAAKNASDAEAAKAARCAIRGDKRGEARHSARAIYLTKTVREELGQERFRSLYNAVNSGEADDWAVPGANWAQKSGLIIGRDGKYGPNSLENKNPLTIQRFATVLSQFNGQIRGEISRQSLLGKIAFWLIVLYLLWRLLRWLLRRRNGPAGPAPFLPGPMPAPVVPAVPAPGTSNRAWRGGGAYWG